MRSLLATLPTENVVFTGILPQSQLAKKMSASHLLVLPSIEEGLALVQGQAMACGCPVLATTATGAEDLFTDGEQGFIVPDRDVDALTQRMQQIADDPTLQRKLSEAALLRSFAVETLGGLGPCTANHAARHALLCSQTARPASTSPTPTREPAAHYIL